MIVTEVVRDIHDVIEESSIRYCVAVELRCSAAESRQVDPGICAAHAAHHGELGIATSADSFSIRLNRGSCL